MAIETKLLISHNYPDLFFFCLSEIPPIDPEEAAMAATRIARRASQNRLRGAATKEVSTA